MGDAIKNWFAVDIVCELAATEAIESAFNVLEALGTEIDSLRKVKGEPLRVSGYFDALPDNADIRTATAESLAIYGFSADAVKSVETRTVEQTDWLAEWKKHWKPTVIGRFIITPPWESIGETEKIVIIIEPNMAFGTGTHETTQLCLKAIGEIYSQDQTFLDVGTGTGILAIAAAKLAAVNPANNDAETTSFAPNSVFSTVKILACDTDADSVKIARENAVLNGVGDRIEFFNGPIDAQTPFFDFVCANLTIDVILPILDLLIAKTSSVLLLSGILAEQATTIADALRSRQISDFDIVSAGEWISVIIRLN